MERLAFSPLLLCVTAKVHRAEFMRFLRGLAGVPACEQNTETWPGSGPEVAEAY